MKLQKRYNKKGAVLLTVIILSMVLSFVAISIMSTSVGSVKTSQVVIDDTKSEYLGQSYFYEYHQQMMNTETNSLPEGVNENIGLKNFTADSAATVNPTYNTNQITITISY